MPSAATRATLIRAALELFEEHGFDGTTAAQIARRAGVTEMTFFRYFPTKDAVLVADPYDPLIAEAVALQDPALPPLAAATAGVLQAWGSIPEPDADEVRERLRVVARTPSLRSALARNSQATEDAIAEALQRRGSDRRSAAIAAAATVAALNAALLAWAATPSTALGDAIRGAIEVLEGGAA